MEWSFLGRLWSVWMFLTLRRCSVATIPRSILVQCPKIDDWLQRPDFAHACSNVHGSSSQRFRNNNPDNQLRITHRKIWNTLELIGLEINLFLIIGHLGYWVDRIACWRSYGIDQSDQNTTLPVVHSEYSTSSKNLFDTLRDGQRPLSSWWFLPNHHFGIRLVGSRRSSTTEWFNPTKNSPRVTTRTFPDAIWTPKLIVSPT